MSFIDIADGREIGQLRADAEELLTNTATVRRKTSTPSGGGGFTVEWNDQGFLPARIAPVGGGEGKRTGGRVVDETTHLVTVPAQSDVTEEDRLVVDAITYEVTLVRRRGDLEVVRVVEVKEAP